MARQISRIAAELAAAENHLAQGDKPAAANGSINRLANVANANHR
jgi:hypothetical protein